jgi:hypothetical protein
MLISFWHRKSFTVCEQFDASPLVPRELAKIVPEDFALVPRAYFFNHKIINLFNVKTATGYINNGL